MGFKAHIYQENEIIEQFIVILRLYELSLSHLLAQNIFEKSKLLQNHHIRVISLDYGDVEMDKLVPTGVENFVQKAILVSIPPQRYKRVVVFVGGLVISVVEHIVYVESVETFE